MTKRELLRCLSHYPDDAPVLCFATIPKGGARSGTGMLIDVSSVCPNGDAVQLNAVWCETCLGIGWYRIAGRKRRIRCHCQD